MYSQVRKSVVELDVKGLDCMIDRERGVMCGGNSDPKLEPLGKKVSSRSMIREI